MKNVRFPAGSELVKFCTKVLCHVHFYISSDANVTFAPLSKVEGQGMNAENLLRAVLKPTFERHLKFIEYLQKATLQFAEIVLMQTLRLPSRVQYTF